MFQSNSRSIFPYVELYFNTNPQNITYDLYDFTKLKAHIRTCLSTGIIQSFPETTVTALTSCTTPSSSSTQQTSDWTPLLSEYFKRQKENEHLFKMKHRNTAHTKRTENEQDCYLHPNISKTQDFLQPHSNKRQMKRTRANMSETAKFIAKQTNKLRMKHKRANMTAIQKFLLNERDKTRKKQNRANMEVHDKHTLQQKEKYRKKQTRANMEQTEKHNLYKSDNTRKKLQRANMEQTEKHTLQESEKNRKKQ